jgi:S-adenosylmethionine hydrolase
MCKRSYKSIFSLILLALTTISIAYASVSGIVVFQSDFGVKDGAVSAVKGVMYTVDKSLIVSDLTNEITPFNIWEAAYRLHQTANYWPAGTVFVSVVDPGVGTARRSIVALANNGQYFVTPDNGTLTLINDEVGIKEVRTIDETKNRLKGSGASYTFHGRDVYGYTAARLASGKISFEEVGPVLHDPVVRLSYQKPLIKNNTLEGTVVILDPQYGNVWTNIDKKLIDKFGVKLGERYRVNIYQGKKLRYSRVLALHNTFGEVKKGADLLYLNSLLNLSVATNQGNFAKDNQIGSGPDWLIRITKK